MNKEFIFQRLEERQSSDDELIGVLPLGIVGTNHLLCEIGLALFFPAYYGCNWNALFDCLRNFDWVEQRSIVLVHNDLPRLTKMDLKIYLELLLQAINDWRPEESHDFSVIFGEACRNQVAEALL